MDHADTAQLAAVAGGLGAVLVLIARTRPALVAGFALLAAAEAGLVLADGGLALGDVVSPVALAAAVVGAGALAAAAYGLVRHRALVIPLVLAAAPFRPPVDFDPDHRFLVAVADPGKLGRLLPLYVVLAAAALALVVRVAMGERVIELPRLLSMPASAFVAFASLSLLWSSDVAAGADLLAFFLLPFAVLVAVVARAPFPAWMPRALATIAIGLASLFALVGLWQTVTQRLLFFAPNLEVANTYTSFFRVTSLFRDPSLYGRHVVLGIAVVLVALLLRRLSALVAAPLVALLFAGLYFSYSQSSLVALFVVTLVVAAVAGDRRTRLVVAAAAALLGVLSASLVAITARDESVQRATSDRSRRVELTARVVEDHPLVGVGIGAQPRESQARADRFGPTPRFVSHTTPLTVAAELGALGLALYVALLAAALWLIEQLRRRDGPLGLALGAALLALAVHSLFYSGFFEDPITWLVLGVAAAALAARVPVAAPAPLEERERRPALQTT